MTYNTDDFDIIQLGLVRFVKTLGQRISLSPSTEAVQCENLETTYLSIARKQQSIFVLLHDQQKYTCFINPVFFSADSH